MSETFDRILAEGDEPDVINAVTQALEAAKQARYPYEQVWKTSHKQYRAHLDAKKWPWQSKLKTPLSFSVVETIIPRLIANTPRPEVVAKHANAVEAAKTQSKWLQWASSESLTGFRRKVRAGVKSGLIFGSGVWKTEWHYEERVHYAVEAPVRAIEAEDGLLDAVPDYGSEERVHAARPYVAYDNPTFRPVSVFDLYPSPEALDIQGAEYVIEKSLVPHRVIEQLVEDGVYESRVLDELEQSWSGISDDDKYAHQMLAEQIGMAYTDQSQELIRPVMIWEVWAEPGLRATVLNGRILANTSDWGRTNPFSHGQKPYVKWDDYETEDQFWGIGTLEMISSVQREIDNVRNMRMDGAQLALSPMYLLREGEIDLRQAQTRPGGIVPVNTITPLSEIIQEIPRPNVPAVAYEESTFLIQMLNEAVGVTDYARGKDAPTRDTATEVNAKNEGTNARFRLKSENLDTAVQQIWEQWQLLGAQFVTEPTQVPNGRGEKLPFVDVSPEDFTMDTRIMVQPTSAQESIMEKRVLALDKLQLMGTNEILLQQHGWAGMRKLLLDFYESEGIVNPEEYLQGDEPEPEPPPEAALPPDMMMPGEEGLPAGGPAIADQLPGAALPGGQPLPVALPPDLPVEIP